MTQIIVLHVDLFAPGVNIKTTAKNGGYTYGSGTSLATPYVAGVAALLLSYCPKLTTIQLRDWILNNVDEMESLNTKCVTGGILNAQKTLEHIHETEFKSISIMDGNGYVCKYCTYSCGKSPHEWLPAKIIAGNVVSYMCAQCKVKSMRIPVKLESIASKFQAELTALTLTGEGYVIIEVDEHTVIVYDNGRIYLMVECDEFGNFVADVPDEIFAQGYTLDRIIAEQQVE